MRSDWEWIVPFKGRNHSGATTQNFLCRSGNVYVMDNHRSALWCWLQEVDLAQPHSLIHIDRHNDTLQCRLDELCQHLPDWSAGIDDYLRKTVRLENIDCPVIRWDNYLSIYLREFGSKLQTLRFLTHDDGDAPNFDRTLFSPLWDLPWNLDYWLSASEGPWIVNIDLDYFFYQTEESYELMVSENYLRSVAEGLRKAMQVGSVGAVTLCLTPDSFTPGWGATEELATRILERLDLKFELPKAP